MIRACISNNDFYIIVLVRTQFRTVNKTKMLHAGIEMCRLRKMLYLFAATASIYVDTNLYLCARYILIYTHTHTQKVALRLLHSHTHTHTLIIIEARK